VCRKRLVGRLGLAVTFVVRPVAGWGERGGNPVALYRYQQIFFSARRVYRYTSIPPAYNAIVSALIRRNRPSSCSRLAGGRK